MFFWSWPSPESHVLYVAMSLPSSLSWCRSLSLFSLPEVSRLLILQTVPCMSAPAWLALDPACCAEAQPTRCVSSIHVILHSWCRGAQCPLVLLLVMWTVPTWLRWVFPASFVLFAFIINAYLRAEHFEKREVWQGYFFLSLVETPIPYLSMPVLYGLVPMDFLGKFRHTGPPAVSERRHTHSCIWAFASALSSSLHALLTNDSVSGFLIISWRFQFTGHPRELPSGTTTALWFGSYHGTHSHLPFADSFAYCLAQPGEGLDFSYLAQCGACAPVVNHSCGINIGLLDECKRKACSGTCYRLGS